MTLMQASNGKFYGTNVISCDNSSIGDLFEWNNETNTYLRLESLMGISYVTEALNGKFYGLEEFGGLGKGALWEWDTLTSEITDKIFFGDSIYGSYPRGSLFQASNGKLYGRTTLESLNNVGVLFEWDPVTNKFAIKSDPKNIFNLSIGPYNSLTEIVNSNTGDTTKVDLLTGLIAYYPFNGSANDGSGNGHHGTSNGGTLTTDRFGLQKGAYDFTGEENTLAFSGFQIMDTRLTICGWVKITDANADTVLFSNSKSLKIVLRIVNHRYLAELSFGGKQIILSDENGAFEIDPQQPEFDFLAFSYDGIQLKFRINDQVVDSRNINNILLQALFPYTFCGDIRYLFHGVLDEFRIIAEISLIRKSNTCGWVPIGQYPLYPLIL